MKVVPFGRGLVALTLLCVVFLEVVVGIIDLNRLRQIVKVLRLVV